MFLLNFQFSIFNFQFIRSVLLCLFISLATLSLDAQKLSSTSKKAIKEYDAGYSAYSQKRFQQAISYLNNAVKQDPKFIEAHLLIAESYLELEDLPKSKEAYLRCIAINPNFFPPAYYSLAEIDFELGEYEEASNYLDQYLKFTNQRASLRSAAEKLQKNAVFAAQATKNPVPYEPHDLGPNINIGYDQYWPSLSVDEQTLVFTALIPIDPNNPRVVGNRQEDFFISTFENDEWSPARNMGPPLNTPDNEGAQTITSDASKIYFTACNRSDGKGGCDIYYSERRNGQWTRPKNLGAPINTSAKETQPSISSDQQTLYFVSTRPGGKGEQDIWYSTLNENGTWGNPVNLEEINTSDNESSPFIHPDNQTLYFASTGWPGMGNYDLFVTRKDSTGKWSEPKNLGYPINSKYNEEGLIINARGDKAYYSSDRGNENHVRNIYSFELYPEIRPTPVSYMKGKIYDAKYYKPLKARFELIDLSSTKQVIQSQSDSITGEFLVCLPVGKSYALNISRKGYLFHSEHFMMGSGTFSKPFLKDIPLRQIAAGEKVVLENIFFEFDSYRLLDESKFELQRIIRFLKENPDVKVQMTGHTDNVGNAKYNLDLSQNRARAVANYLLGEGIPMNRVTYRGKGVTEPIASNDTEEGRAQNRRTEMNIVK